MDFLIGPDCRFSIAVPCDLPNRHSEGFAQLPLAAIFPDCHCERFAQLSLRAKRGNLVSVARALAEASRIALRPARRFIPDGDDSTTVPSAAHLFQSWKSSNPKNPDSDDSPPATPKISSPDPPKIDTPKTGVEPSKMGVEHPKTPHREAPVSRKVSSHDPPDRAACKTPESRFSPLESPNHVDDVIRHGCDEPGCPSKTARHPQSSARLSRAHFRKSPESGFPALYDVAGVEDSHHAMIPIPIIPGSCKSCF